MIVIRSDWSHKLPHYDVYNARGDVRKILLPGLKDAKETMQSTLNDLQRNWRRYRDEYGQSMTSDDESDARITEGFGRAAQFLGEVFDDPSLLDDIPPGAHILIADDAADEIALAETAALMTAAGKPATVYRLGRARSSQRTGSGS